MPCAWAAAAGANRTAVAAKRSAKALMVLFMMFTSTHARALAPSAMRLSVARSCLMLGYRVVEQRSQFTDA